MPELSIVGERLLKQAQEEAHTLWASPSDVDAYVATATAKVLTCRDKGRHNFPTLAELREQGVELEFVDATSEGLLVREPIFCETCQEAYQEQLWEATGSGKHMRMRFVAAQTRYKAGGGYLSKSGGGRITSKMIRESLATAMVGSRTPQQLKRQALARAAAARKEQADKYAAEMAAS